MSVFDNFSDEELRAEIIRRDRAAIEASWQRTKANGKYFCPDCAKAAEKHIAELENELTKLKGTRL